LLPLTSDSVLPAALPDALPIWAGAYLRAAPRHVVDQLGVPHDRRAAVQGAGQVGELLAAGDPVARRVLAQPAPRRPDVRAARRQAWADRHLGADDLAVREVRLGLRRALADRTTAGAPGGEGVIGSASRRVDNLQPWRGGRSGRADPKGRPRRLRHLVCG